MINYKTESFRQRINSVTDGRGVGIILDFIGAPYWNDNLAALAIGGKLMLIGFLGGASGDLNIDAIMCKRLTVIGNDAARHAPAAEDRTDRGVRQTSSAAVRQQRASAGDRPYLPARTGGRSARLHAIEQPISAKSSCASS